MNGWSAAAPDRREDLHRPARLPGGSADVSRNISSLTSPRARTRQEDAARRDRLQGQAVHVEVLLEGEVDLLAVARLLRRVEHHDVEALPRRQ